MRLWPIACVCLFMLVALINPKTRLTRVIKEQFNIYRNDRNGKIYWLDIVTFIGFPMALSVIIAPNISLADIITHAGSIITVFSLIATLPLSFLALLIDKILKGTKKEEVSKEVFISITIDIIYSMIVIGMIVIALYSKVSELLQNVIVGTIAFLVIKIILNILMILKRVFSIWDN